MDPRPASRTGWQSALTSIRGRLTLLGALGVLAVLAASLVELQALRGMHDRIEAENIAHQVTRARRALELRQQQKAAIITELAAWDEAYSYASNPHRPGSEAFIQDNYTGWLPVRYGDRIIKIWNRKREPLLNWSDSSFGGLDRWMPADEIIATTIRRRTVGGFLNTPRGLFLAGASVILRSSDEQMLGEANGVVFAAQPVDSVMESWLGKDLQASFHVLAASGWLPSDSLRSTVVAGGDSTSILFPLIGMSGKVVAVVELRDSRAYVHGVDSFIYVILTATLVGGILVLAILWLGLKRMVLRPLGSISSELEAMGRDGEMRELESSHPAAEWRLFARAFNRTIRALKLSEERYQVLFQQAVDAYILVDSFSKVILEANPAAEVLAGCTAQDMVGRPLATIIDFSSASNQAGAFTLRRPDGRTSTVGVVSTEIQLGGIYRTLVSIRDLSQYEKMQVQLRQAQKMDAIGSLAGGVAHDFNNLLGAILVANSTLQDDLRDRVDVADSLNIIDRATRQASELTRQLLRLARREQPRNVPLVLNGVVERVVALCRRTFNPAVRIETRLDPALPAMIGDASQLEQAVLSLCINARDAMPGGGMLTLTTRVRMVNDEEAERDRNLSPVPHISLVVDDTGPGLTSEAERHLFEPFFTTKERGKGTGLGLPTAYGTVRAHGGTISFSNRPGSGVSFELLFALSGTATPKARSERPLHFVGGTERILVIDDDASLRPAVCRSLERLGYSVVTAEGGWAGVKAVEQDKAGFDLVLLDVIMPDLSGVETFKRIRALQPDLRVLVCSGYTAEGELQQLMNSGAEAFLPKPFDLAELSQAVRDVLTRATASNP